MSKHLFIGAVLLICAFVTPAMAQTQDISGGARMIFGKPENPTSARQDELAAKGGRVPSTASESSDKVDDAIALGNAARDRKPPDLESAEKAYQLAWKLNPRDPRPFVGLGNVYMDQGKYAEAARAYKNALNLAMPKGPLAGVRGAGFALAEIVSKSSSSERRSNAEWLAYLATAHLGEQKLREAEEYLNYAIIVDPERAELHALLGYCLFLQERYSASSIAYARAVQLDASNPKYQELQSESSRKAEKASANDQALSKALARTTWQVRSDRSPAGICRLKSDQSVDCDFIDNDLIHTALTWKVQDGLLLLSRDTDKNPICLGPVTKDKILITCLVTNHEKSETWAKRIR
jgi:cytochrome c-type biogenesis protein CcmH/NrfG